MNKFLQSLALIGFSIAAFIFQMFVLIKLWGYIAVPMGAPAVDFAHAFGISMIITLFLPLPGKQDGEGAELAVKRILHSFFSSLFALGFGYWVFG